MIILRGGHVERERVEDVWGSAGTRGVSRLTTWRAKCGHVRDFVLKCLKKFTFSCKVTLVYEQASE